MLLGVIGTFAGKMLLHTALQIGGASGVVAAVVTKQYVHITFHINEFVPFSDYLLWDISSLFL